MINQNLTSITIIDILIVLCHLTVILSFLLSGIYLFFKLKNKPKAQRDYLLGVSLFFILYGTARMIMFLFELTFEPFVWQIPVDKFNQIFRNNPELEIQHDIMWRLTTGIGGLGLVIIIYQLEKTILEMKTKYLFTIITIITIIPSLLLGVSGKDEITWVRIVLYTGNFIAVAIPLFYFYYAFKTQGETRKRALGAALGVFILFIGIVFNSSVGKTVLNTSYGLPGLYLSYYLYALFVTIGIVIYMRSIKY